MTLVPKNCARPFVKSIPQNLPGQTSFRDLPFVAKLPLKFDMNYVAIYLLLTHFT